MRFDVICTACSTEHRCTNPEHPWTNRQVERMNRTLKATLTRYHEQSQSQLRTHLNDLRDADISIRWLKTLGYLKPDELIYHIWTPEPNRLILQPISKMPGLKAYEMLS